MRATNIINDITDVFEEKEGGGEWFMDVLDRIRDELYDWDKETLILLKQLSIANVQLGLISSLCDEDGAAMEVLGEDLAKQIKITLNTTNQLGIDQNFAAPINYEQQDLGNAQETWRKLAYHKKKQ